MKQMKKYLVLVLIFAIGISILPMNANAAKKVRLNKTKVTMQVGKTVQLKVKNNKKKVIWVSREKKIASVTSKGVVKGRKKGTTYIYAIANHKLYKCKLKVC